MKTRLAPLRISRLAAAFLGIFVAALILKPGEARGRAQNATVWKYYSDSSETVQVGVERWNCAGGHSLSGVRGTYVSMEDRACIPDQLLDHSLCDGYLSAEDCPGPDNPGEPTLDTLDCNIETVVVVYSCI